jgi:hypothetical protein
MLNPVKSSLGQQLSASNLSLADFSFGVEELREILSRLVAGAAMYAGADFFVP